MVRIVAEMKLKEGCKAKVLEMAKELIEKSQAEAGCIDYILFQDRTDENTVTFIEAWQDDAAIEIHNNSDHYTTIVPKLGECVEASIVKLYDEL